MKMILLIPGKAVAACICLLVLMTGETALSQTLTLPQVLDSIAARNPGLRQFALKTSASKAQGEAASAWMAPSIGAGLSEFPYPGAEQMTNGMMPRKMVMLRLTQMFPNFDKQKKEAAWHQSFAHQYEDDRATMQNRLFAKAKVAYIDAYIAAKKLTVLDEQEKQLQLLIQIAEGRLAYHQASLPNIYKARAKLSDVQSTRILITSTASQSASIINTLMNLPAGRTLTIDTSEKPELEQMGILQADSTFVATNRTDVIHTADEIHSMELEKEVSAAAAKPVFGVTWDNMRMPSGMYMYNAMATISIPIAPWSSKGYKSQVRSIDDQIEAMRQMRAEQISETVGNIRKDWLNLQAAREDLQLFHTEVIPAYQKTFQANLHAFSENTGDIYETLMAWNELTAKKMEYYDKLANMLNISVVLDTEMQTHR